MSKIKNFSGSSHFHFNPCTMRPVSKSAFQNDFKKDISKMFQKIDSLFQKAFQNIPIKSRWFFFEVRSEFHSKFRNFNRFPAELFSVLLVLWRRLKVRKKVQVMNFLLFNKIWPRSQQVLPKSHAEKYQKWPKSDFLDWTGYQNQFSRALACVLARGRYQIRKVWVLWMQNALWMKAFKAKLADIAPVEVWSRK